MENKQSPDPRGASPSRVHVGGDRGSRGSGLSRRGRLIARRLACSHHWRSSVWIAGEQHLIEGCFVTSRPMLQLLPGAPPCTEVWDRQSLALGSRAIVDLRQLRVGVVGTGGLGDPISIGLLRLGVGELVLVDPDQAEASNLSRLLSVNAQDVGKAKAEVIGGPFVRSCLDAKSRAGSPGSRIREFDRTSRHAM